jgi:hypothetical protein
MYVDFVGIICMLCNPICFMEGIETKLKGTYNKVILDLLCKHCTQTMSF